MGNFVSCMDFSSPATLYKLLKGSELYLFVSVLSTLPCLNENLNWNELKWTEKRSPQSWRIFVSHLTRTFFTFIFKPSWKNNKFYIPKMLLLLLSLKQHFSFFLNHSSQDVHMKSSVMRIFSWLSSLMKMLFHHFHKYLEWDSMRPWLVWAPPEVELELIFEWK